MCKYRIFIQAQIINLKKTNMKNYSRQLDKFVESKLYATSVYRQADCRTWVSYYIDESKLIHSSGFNYSIIGARPVTEAEFKCCMECDKETAVMFKNN